MSAIRSSRVSAVQGLLIEVYGDWDFQNFPLYRGCSLLRGAGSTVELIFFARICLQVLTPQKVCGSKAWYSI